ncbi:MAG TPA: MBL fold metallo-hydrolase [Polyangia bacterium]
MIELEFVGAAQTVTGSKHILRTKRATVLLDCGLFQGRRRESFDRNRNLRVDPASLDAVVLSHAHIDHSGALPLLVRQGFGGTIYTTPATRDLAAPMLMDAAMIQASDARFIDRLIEKGEVGIEPVEPLYTEADVTAMLSQMIDLPYGRRQVIADGVAIRFLDAGHVLGSAITVLEVDDEGDRVVVAYTGDLGRHHLPILRDPQVPDGVHHLVMESTYGDRLHPPIAEMDEALAALITRTVARGGKIIIPSFALERAQEVIYELKRLKAAGRLPPVPVYVDSPLAVKLTDVFRLHPECYDTAARELLQAADSPFDFPGLSYVSSPEDSKFITAEERPSIIIAGSGMCEGGRVLHHLRALIGDARNAVAIVGFQAPHTLGRRLVEGRREVRIFGMLRERRAEVVVFNGFSAHADQNDLVSFAEKVRDRGKLRSVFLVHGEPPAQSVLTERLTERGFPSVTAPAPSTRFTL